MSFHLNMIQSSFITMHHVIFSSLHWLDIPELICVSKYMAFCITVNQLIWANYSEIYYQTLPDHSLITSLLLVPQVSQW